MRSPTSNVNPIKQANEIGNIIGIAKKGSV